MGFKIYAKTTISVILLAALAACGNSRQLEVEKKSLQTENEALKARVQQLTDENSKFKSELGSLKAELEDLKQTDQYLFSKAKEEFDAYKSNDGVSNLRAAKELLDKLLTRFPNSTYKSQATAISKDVNGKLQIVDMVENGKSEINSAISKQEFNKAWFTLNSIKKYISGDQYSELGKAIDKEENKPIDINLRDLLADWEKYNGRRVKVGSLEVLSHSVSGKLLWLSTGGPTTGDPTINVFYDALADTNLRSLDRGRRIGWVIGKFSRNPIDREFYIRAEKISY